MAIYRVAVAPLTLTDETYLSLPVYQFTLSGVTEEEAHQKAAELHAATVKNTWELEHMCLATTAMALMYAKPSFDCPQELDAAIQWFRGKYTEVRAYAFNQPGIHFPWCDQMVGVDTAGNAFALVDTSGVSTWLVHPAIYE